MHLKKYEITIYLFITKKTGITEICVTSLCVRPSREQILQQCKFLVRKLEYEETAKVDAIKAMHFLQTRLSELVDHQNPIQLNEVYASTYLLFYKVRPLNVIFLNSVP